VPKLAECIVFATTPSSAARERYDVPHVHVKDTHELMERTSPTKKRPKV